MVHTPSPYIIHERNKTASSSSTAAEKVRQLLFSVLVVACSLRDHRGRRSGKQSLSFDQSMYVMTPKSPIQEVYKSSAVLGSSPHRKRSKRRRRPLAGGRRGGGGMDIMSTARIFGTPLISRKVERMALFCLVAVLPYSTTTVVGE